MSDEKYLLREFQSIDQSLFSSLLNEKKSSFLFKDKTGKISKEEFRRLVFENESLQGFRNETIEKYIDQLSNQTESINYQQFKQFMNTDTNGINNPLVLIELKLAFDDVDTNKDGFISSYEARRGITLAGQFIPGFSFDRIAQAFDDNRDGLLSFQEFINHITQMIPSNEST